MLINITLIKKKYLKNLFSETYIKDVIERNNIQNNQEILEILLDFLAQSIDSFITPLKLLTDLYLKRK